MRRREPINGAVFSEGCLTVARVAATGSYSFHSLDAEPAAILTRIQTLALVAALLSDLTRGGSITLGETTA
jgi:hypothetical protein